MTDEWNNKIDQVGGMNSLIIVDWKTNFYQFAWTWIMNNLKVGQPIPGKVTRFGIEIKTNQKHIQKNDRIGANFFVPIKINANISSVENNGEIWLIEFSFINLAVRSKNEKVMWNSGHIFWRLSEKEMKKKASFTLTNDVHNIPRVRMCHVYMIRRVLGFSHWLTSCCGERISVAKRISRRYVRRDEMRNEAGRK